MGEMLGLVLMENTGGLNIKVKRQKENSGKENERGE